jgi:hypothetical protein
MVLIGSQSYQTCEDDSIPVAAFCLCPLELQLSALLQHLNTKRTCSLSGLQRLARGLSLLKHNASSFCLACIKGLMNKILINRIKQVWINFRNISNKLLAGANDLSSK